MRRQKNDILEGTLVLLILETLVRTGAELGVTEKNRQARFYTITRTGRKQLALDEESCVRLQSGVQCVLGYV